MLVFNCRHPIIQSVDLFGNAPHSDLISKRDLLEWLFGKDRPLQNLETWRRWLWGWGRRGEPRVGCQVQPFSMAFEKALRSTMMLVSYWETTVVVGILSFEMIAEYYRNVPVNTRASSKKNCNYTSFPRTKFNASSTFASWRRRMLFRRVLQKVQLGRWCTDTNSWFCW